MEDEEMEEILKNGIEEPQINIQPKKHHLSLTQFMDEKRMISRWIVVIIALCGMFVGAILGILSGILGFIK